MNLTYKAYTMCFSLLGDGQSRASEWELANVQIEEKMKFKKKKSYSSNSPHVLSHFCRLPTIKPFGKTKQSDQST